MKIGMIQCPACDGPFISRELARAAPALLESAKLTLELFERGLQDVSPEAKRFEATLRKVIAMAEGEGS